MANKRSSGVGYRPLNLDGLLPQGLLGVNRDRGQVEKQVAGVFNRIASQAGTMADRAAQDEGARAGRIAGQDENFRPINGSSIRSRAYDRVGERQYMQQLETNLRSEMQAIYEQNRDNPAALAGKFEDLRLRYHENDVYDEIAGDFDAGFERLSSAYRNQAIQAFDARQKDLARANLYERLSDHETQTAQAIESVDPSTEAGAAIVGDAVRAHSQDIDEAVAAGQITAVQGERQKREFQQGSAVAFYSRKAKSIGSIAELENYSQQLSEDFSNGKLQNVDAAAWDAIKRSIEAQKRALVAQDSRASKALVKAGNDMAERIALGRDPEPGKWTQFQDLADRTAQGDEIAEITGAKMRVARMLRSSSLDESRQIVADLRNQADSDAGFEVVDFADKIFKSIETEVAKDPVGAAAVRGVLDDPGHLVLNEGVTADQMSDAVAERIPAMEAAAEHWGVPVRILRPGEARTIGKFVKDFPEAGVEIAGGLLTGSQDHAAHVLAELDGHAAAQRVAQAGRLIAAGGSREAAIDVFRGMAKDATGKERPRLSNSVAQDVAVEEIGGAIGGADFELVRGAAANIARARMADQGVAPDSPEAQDIYKRALQEAAGARFEANVQYGGIADRDRAGWFTGTDKVLVPPNMRADLFGDVIDAIRDEDLAALPAPPVDAEGVVYPARDLHRALPVAVPGGYAFATGDEQSPRYIRSAGGRPFILDIQGMRDVLGQRVPGAWQ